ncbi:hypothetical protein XM38_014760 [Halomicronema hongdechloris C2206]|uniref:N-acetyltransferase domain-containing protein n=1 Tax=Halomicronema hongdechloris C2206 TaxID=1641165 RepID=A0A1Z3HKC5_9CYAN|nr:GNAT family N-acetyltransferase [Halomicronema hongdechloris]ASC70537.1 hypothetical protein XM38_014760 [Halomicronema hongdechloris C2206]
MPLHIPIQRRLRDSTPVELDAMGSHEALAVQAMLNAIIAVGQTYPQEQSLSWTDFTHYWMKGHAFVVRQCQENPINTEKTPEIIGAFYIKPNFPGRCSHICNAGFIVPPEVRRRGIGRLMGEEMLGLARQLGYRAVMFNLVFETNIPSLKLWDSLGFSRLGQIPEAVHLPDGSFVDAVMFYKSLL